MDATEEEAEAVWMEDVGGAPVEEAIGNDVGDAVEEVLPRPGGTTERVEED